MDGKPTHYDGSVQGKSEGEVVSGGTEAFVLTDEMRKNLGSNPFILQNEE